MFVLFFPVLIVAIRRAVCLARFGDMRNAHTILARKPEGKISFERRRRRREDNAKINLILVWCEGVAWVHLAQKGTSRR